MKDLLASVLPQDSGLEVTTSRGYNMAIAISGLLVAAGIAFGLHAFLIGHEHAYTTPERCPGGC